MSTVLSNELGCQSAGAAVTVIRSLAIFTNHAEELVDGFLEPRMPMLRLLGSVAWNNRFGLFFVLFNLHLCTKVQVTLSTACITIAHLVHSLRNGQGLHHYLGSK